MWSKILVFAELRRLPLSEIRGTQMPTSFLTDTNVNLPTVEIKTTTDPNSGREFVKVMVVGSAKGVVKIIHTLYRVGFAEVTEWSPATPTANPGEVMSVMRRCVLLD
jgi:hypothetical protein